MSRPEAAVDEHVLDNAVWHTLGGAHAHLAEVASQARRYDPEISVFAAVADDSPRSWDDLAALATGDGTVVLFRGAAIIAPSGWTLLDGGQGLQMVLAGGPIDAPSLPAVDVETGCQVSMRPLGDDDIPTMVALVRRTQPGPFRRRTIELGGYVGIFHDDQLVAMAGQRLRPPGWCEISAVCTDPGARRRGYASIVTAAVATSIAERGEVPFLHLAIVNRAAQELYERLGFMVRRTVEFNAYRAPH